MTNSNVRQSPRSIALAAARRLEAMIAMTKHDPFLQQAMLSANLVVHRSGILAAHQAEQSVHQSRVKHAGSIPTLH